MSDNLTVDPEHQSVNGSGPAKPEATDPFDINRIRSASLEDIGVERVTLTIPVRRPARNEFFRVHPDPDMTVDWYVVERDDDMDHETYWVTEEFRGALLDETRERRGPRTRAPTRSPGRAACWTPARRSAPPARSRAPR
jgi:hypothetical protein